MALVRRSRIVVRPNLAPKVKKPDASGEADFTEAAPGSGAVQPESGSAQPRDSSLLIDSGRVSLESEPLPSQMTGQTASLNDGVDGGYSSELSAAGATHPSGDQLKENADFVSNAPLVPDRNAGHASSTTDPGVTTRDGTDEQPVLAAPATGFVRRSCIVTRPNLALKGKKLDACGQADVTKAAAGTGVVQPESGSVQSRDSSLLIDNGSVSMESDKHPSPTTGQTDNLNDGQETELSAAGVATTSGNRLEEKADFVRSATLVPDLAAGHVNNRADPGVTTLDSSDEQPVVSFPTMAFVRRSRIVVRPNLALKGKQPDASAQADNGCVSLESDTCPSPMISQAGNLNDGHDSGHSTELSAAGVTTPFDCQLKEKTDVVNNTTVFPDQDAGHPSNVTHPGITTRDGSDEGPMIAHPTTSFVRRSRVVVRPNFAPKGKQAAASGEAGITKAALGNTAMQPESSCGQSRDGSLLIDNGCVSLASGAHPSQMTDQTANLNDSHAGGDSSKLSAAGATHPSSGQLKEKAVCNTSLVSDRDAGLVSSTTDPGVTTRDGTDEQPVVSVPATGFVRRSRVVVRPNLAPKGKQADACSPADVTKAAPGSGAVQPESGSVQSRDGSLLIDSGRVSLKRDTHPSPMTGQTAHLNDGQESGSTSELSAAAGAARDRVLPGQIMADEFVVAAGAHVSAGVHLASQESVAAAATDGSSVVSRVQLQQDTVPASSCAGAQAIAPTASRDAESDTCMISQDSVELRSPTVAARPRPRLKVRPNIAADASRAKHAKHGGVTSQHTVTRQKNDFAHETAAESRSADRYATASAADPAVLASDGDPSPALRRATGNGPPDRAGAVREMRSAGESTAEVIANSSLSSAAPAPVKKQKVRRKVTTSAEPVDRSKMTMKELLYWNPTSNPMAKPAAQPLRSQAEQQVIGSKSDEVPTKPSDAAPSGGSGDAATDAFAADPVPQVMIGEDGQIILNESSLIIHSAPVVHPESADIAVEDHRNYVTSSSFRKRLCTKFWSSQDTCRFYKALSYVGTDFSMMNKLFPKRTRAELKNKFKKEEKQNKKRVDAALLGELRFDAEAFTDSESSSSESPVSCNKAKSKAKGPPAKSSKSTMSPAKRRKMSEEESNLSIDDSSSAQRSSLEAEEVIPVSSQAESEPVGKRTHAASIGSPRSDVVPDGDGLQAKSAQTNKEMTVLPVTDPLSNVEAGQLIFVVPDSSAEDSHGGSNNMAPPGQQVIHVYVVSPPD